MISPKKHLDLDHSVLRATALILKEIEKRRVVELEVIRRKLGKPFGQDADLVFLPAVNLLFLLGRVCYHPKNDTLEYREA